MSRLHDLLRQLEARDPALAKELRSEYDALTDRRAFGLNFERHVPESVELPGRAVRRGDKVHVVPERGKHPTAANSRLWRVLAVDRAARTATIEDFAVDPPETQEQPLTELVVVAEFRDPIYPGLVSTGRIARGGDKPFHTVINGENYHALQMLLFTHRGQIDCIYIDPPYNTGNEGWIYNDKYVASDDHYKHSKWLAFMERRLLLAKELLKQTGVVIVAIGDEEHHRLRMLMDQTFEAENFLANVTWQGRVKGNAQFGGGGVDYMLMYGLNKGALAATGRRWVQPKVGVREMIALVQSEMLRHNSPELAQKALKAWLRSDAALDVAPGTRAYSLVDETGKIFRPVSLASPEARDSRYKEPLVHPVTGLPCPVPATGWRGGKASMLRKVSEGAILFGRDHTTLPQSKLYLHQMDSEAPKPTFESSRDAGTNHLEKLLGSKRFPFPKDPDVLARWLGLVAGPNATVLDFFAGSGTTGEAVLRLNESDGGTRQVILVTNNELAAGDVSTLRKTGLRPGDPDWESRGVHENVLRPRIAAVVSGIRPDGSIYSEGLAQSIEFFSLTYEAPLRVSSNREFYSLAPLLWLRAGGVGRLIHDLSAGWDVADNYGVLADLDQTEAFLQVLAQREADGAQIPMVFVVTEEERLFASVCRELPADVEAVRLHEAYLRNFEIEAGRSTR